MHSVITAVNATKLLRRVRIWILNQRLFYRAVFCGLVMCSLFVHTFLLAGSCISDGDSMMRIHHETPVLHQEGWALNATSGLLELAQTFDEKGETEVAIALYRKVLNRLPSDNQFPETHRTALSYLCHYRISRCFLFSNDTQDAISHANQAFQILPRREPYYHVARFFDRQENDTTMAMKYYRLAALAPEPPADAPFRETNVYAIDIEKGILWPKAFPHAYLQNLSWYQGILDDTVTDEDVHSQTHDEMIVTSRPLFAAGYEELFRREGPFRPNDTDNEFYYSTPTIVRLHPDRADDFMIVCRLLNYRIDPITRLRRDFLPLGQEPHLHKSALALHRGIGDGRGTMITISDDALQKSAASDFIGPEDPKALRVRLQGGQGDVGDIVLTMTSWEYPGIAGQGARMASGTLHPDRGLLELNQAFPSPYNRKMEKNWAAFVLPEDREARLHFVYEWYPLKIGTLVDKANHVIDFHTVIETPHSFRFLRGSANGVAYRQQEIWFMVHGVGKIGYTYYHKIVVLDAQTLHVKRHSYPFKLEGFYTEFCLGLDIDERNESMTIAYSIANGSSVLRRIALWKIEALMVRSGDSPR